MLVGAAAGLRVALQPVLGDRAQFLIFYPVVLLAGYYGGLFPSLVATALSVPAVICWHALLGIPFLQDAANWLTLTGFVLNGSVIAAIGEALHRARRQAEENRRDQAALRLRNERLALLSEAAAHLLKAENPDTMVRELFEKVCRHLNVQAYFNFMLNDAGDALRLDSCAGIPDEVAASISHLDFGVAVCGTVAQIRQMIHATGIQQSDDPKVQLVKGYQIRAYCCHPLMAGERLLGTLSFGSSAKDRFDEGEVEFMGTICHYVAMAKERLRLEKELRSHLEQLAEADRRKDEFLAMLAHELRNPLAPVRNAVQILRVVGSPEPTAQRQHDTIERQVSHMARLLDDLLDVARVTRGKIELHRAPLHLAGVLTHAIETATPLIQARRHQFQFTPPPEELRVDGDRDRLAQIFGNLLNNAAKYTNPGGHIWLDVTCEDGSAVVRVRDTGVGITPEMLPQVFELFAQADRSRGRERGGLGIGLTMVQKLVELHGGAVEARSAGTDQGSEFIVRLPAQPMAPAAAKPAPVRPEAAGGGASRRVLVVDDITDSAESLAELLGLWGYTTQAAHSGPAALDWARWFKPEVVLLDIGMPGMDGLEVARRLRETYGQEMLLVALTGYGQRHDRDATHAAGFDAHLVKPVDLDSLRTVLEQSEVESRV